MTRIVFIVSSFHPNFSAVGYCVYQVQKCLADKFEVSTIAIHDDPSQPLDDKVGAIRVHRIETSDTRARGLALAEPGLQGRARLIALRLKGALRRLISPQTIDRRLVDAYLERLRAMDPRPEVIVPTVFPFESAIAAVAYKQTHPSVIVVPYVFDDFVDSGSLHVLKVARDLKRARHLRLERRMLEESDAVLAMHPLRRHLEANFDHTLLTKVQFLEHPLMFPAETAAETTADGIIRMCFTGSLIKSVREPHYLINLLNELPIEKPVQADFYVMGNMAKKVPSCVFANGLEIVNNGRVSKSQADAAVARADILINLGERTGRQISSKIFEYMATGKPILHLAYVESDAVTKLLSKYPLALCLIAERSEFKENARKVSEFIQFKSTEEMDFSKVEALYPEAKPSQTSTVIERIINRHYSKWATS